MTKKLLSMAAIVALAIPAGAAGQSANATVAASARVVASLTATTTNDLQFGDLPLGSSATIAADGSATGFGQVHVQHNTNVGVTAVVPTVLTNSATAKTLAFSATCATSSTSGGTGTPVASCAGFDFTAASPGTVQNTYVLVGGTITGDANAGIGTFNGDIVFTFSATN